MENEQVHQTEPRESQIDRNLGIDKYEVAQKSKEQRVVVEEPKKVALKISMSTLSIIFSIVSIALSLISKLFLSVTVAVAFQVFYWLAVLVLLGAMALFVVEMFKQKRVAFTPSFVLMILAILSTTFSTAVL